MLRAQLRCGGRVGGPALANQSLKPCDSSIFWPISLNALRMMSFLTFMTAGKSTCGGQDTHTAAKNGGGVHVWRHGGDPLVWSGRGVGRAGDRAVELRVEVLVPLRLLVVVLRRARRGSGFRRRAAASWGGFEEKPSCGGFGTSALRRLVSRWISALGGATRSVTDER